MQHIQSGLSLARAAVQADRAGSARQAARLYDDAVTSLSQALREDAQCKCIPDNVRLQVECKLPEYLLRASTLRQSFPIQGAHEAPAEAPLQRLPDVVAFSDALGRAAAPVPPVTVSEDPIVEQRIALLRGAKARDAATAHDVVGQRLAALRAGASPPQPTGLAESEQQTSNRLRALRGLPPQTGPRHGVRLQGDVYDEEVTQEDAVRNTLAAIMDEVALERLTGQEVAPCRDEEESRQDRGAAVPVNTRQRRQGLTCDASSSCSSGDDDDSSDNDDSSDSSSSEVREGETMEAYRRRRSRRNKERKRKWRNRQGF